MRQGHPWVLSGSVAALEGDPAAGDSVDVLDVRGEHLGVGDWDPDSQIRVRMMTFGAAPHDPQERWLAERLESALGWRAREPRLTDTNALRLVHSEGDALPALTVDRYADWLSVKLGSPGMQRRADRIGALLGKLTGARGAWLRGEAEPERDRALFGEIPNEPVAIRERGRVYCADLRRGQKTGFYLDQREARDRFQALANGARALDLFAYTGGFSAAALAGGAREVVAVESSAAAHILLRQNAPKAEAVCGDVAEFLRADGRRFDLLVLDPPPFARRKRDVPAAARAYKDLNLWALRRAEPGAHLLTFTCSHHLGADLFRKAVFGAALDAGVKVQVLEVLHAPPDHPVALGHPQGEYLFGLTLRVLDAT